MYPIRLVWCWAPFSTLRKVFTSQRGGLMLEVTVALAVFGAIGTALISGIQASYISKRQFEVQSLSENIIRNQMEHVFEQPYQAPPSTYLTITPPAGYGVTADALVYDLSSTNIEIVRVTVIKDNQAVKVLETLRSNR